MGYVLEAIETNDASLQAAMALVRNDTAPTGKRNDFEAMASFLLPHDPVAKKRAAKRPQGEISAIDSSTIKSGIGSTGVEFRYHTQSEYKKLSKDQKTELREWRLSNEVEQPPKKTPKIERKGKVTFSDQKKFKKMVSEAVVAELTSLDEKKAKEEADKEDVSNLLSLLQAAALNAPTQATPTVAAATSNTETRTPAVTLQSILKRASGKR